MNLLQLMAKRFRRKSLKIKLLMIHYSMKNQGALMFCVLIGFLASCGSPGSNTQAGELSSETIKDPTQKVEVQTLVKTTASWNGTPLPDYHPEHPEMTALRITIPPHTKLPYIDIL